MGQHNCSQNQLGLVYILELTEKNLSRINSNTRWALSKCSAVSPLVSGAFPHYKPDITLLASLVPSDGNGNPKSLSCSNKYYVYKDKACWLLFGE